MAINYGYGLNPNMGQFVSSYLQGTGMQAGAYAEEEKAKQKASAQVGTAFTKMISDIAMSYGKAKKGEQDQAKASYKDDYIEEKARRTHSRDLYNPGSNAWKEQNQSILDLKKEYKADLLAYKGSGTFNRDASLLEFGTEDPTFTGLSDASQVKVANNEKLITDLQKRKQGLEVKDFQKSEALKAKRQKLSEEAPVQAREDTISSRNVDRKEKLSKMRPDTFATPFGQEANKYISERFNENFNRQVDSKTKFLEKSGEKKISKLEEDTTAKINSEKKDIDKQISLLKRSNENEFAEGAKVAEGYDFDPVTGRALKRSDLKLNEQRRYQENKQKDVFRGQALGMMLSAGVDVSDMDTSGTPYSMMNEEQLQAVQNNAMEPELRQKGGDALKFGTPLNPQNKKDASVAKEFGMSVPEFNKHVSVAYETQAQGRIQRAGTNYKALEAVVKDIKTKDPSMLEGTMLTPEYMNQAITDAKGAHQKGMYTSMNQILNMDDPAMMREWLSTNQAKIDQYQADGILPKGFKSTSYDLIQKSSDAKLSSITSKQLGKDLTDLKKLVDFGTEGNFSDRGLNEQIMMLASRIGVDDPNKLITDVQARERLEKELKAVTKRNSEFTLANNIEKQAYQERYGTGPVVQIKGGATVFGEGKGEINVEKQIKNFIFSYTKQFGDTPSKEIEDELRERFDLYNILIGAEQSLKNAVGE